MLMTWVCVCAAVGTTAVFFMAAYVSTKAWEVAKRLAALSTMKERFLLRLCDIGSH